MSRVNFKSPTFSEYPSVFSLINAIWTDEKNRLKIETVKAVIIVKTYFKNLSCAEFYNQILNEKEILEQVHKAEKYFSNFLSFYIVPFFFMSRFLKYEFQKVPVFE
jgi:hypothetical protein